MGSHTRREVEATTARADPSAIWNAFVDLMTTEEVESLSSTQKAAHFAYWYDSEVQNGGHDQFFVNGGTVIVHEAIAALRDLGLRCQAEILDQASEVWLSSERTPETGEEVAPEALDDEDESPFSEHDAAFHNCDPSIIQVLARHLKEHQDEYVVLV